MIDVYSVPCAPETKATTGPEMDRLVIRASDFGTSPAGSLRLEACKEDLYRFTLGYRSITESDSTCGVCGCMS